MKNVIIITSIVALLCACSNKQNDVNSAWEQERMERIKIDFSRSEEQVINYIKRYIPDVTTEQIAAWEESKALECMMIDGEKKYFRNAAPNLFRVDSVARAIKIAKDGDALSKREEVTKTDIPAIIKAAKQTGESLVLPQRIRVTYTLTVNANEVPEGEIVRCWLPFPKENQTRQKDVKLINTNEGRYVIAPAQYEHSTIYMEKIAVKDEPTVFQEVFEYTTSAAYYTLKPEDVKPYDTSTELYKKYTSERDTHIIFSSRIKKLAEELAGDEPNPLLKAYRYFTWISNNFPWASAREYSTITNIPEYVLDNHKGDCGQVTLLFLTLCRYSGIPAHFQSGFMMHPGAWNLHDWGEIYLEGIGWIPVDQSFGISTFLNNEEEKMFFLGGLDPWRMIVNNDYSMPLFPEKKYPRSETVDFQRGEVEWEGGNLYFDKWTYDMDIEYLTEITQ
ncbi:transglutaminase domain-containing protein [Bacteroides sp. 214]|uniref:transglutaminase-like domain-containing protein n=1 Tax=Bacteroides sp. 214 TaxID=2302935 RepID=UPI0013D262B5|nr:transglutaminase domain-containing protein [Bacteroides sp. 214]NDW11430.1 transglutaminase domain-containing protein [Bacteroides sp. 214]